MNRRERAEEQLGAAGCWHGQERYFSPTEKEMMRAQFALYQAQFQPTSRLRLLVRKDGREVLQQAFENPYEGKVEWRDVETVREEDL